MTKPRYESQGQLLALKERSYGLATLKLAKGASYAARLLFSATSMIRSAYFR